MAVRRINYTGRKRIRHEDAKVLVHRREAGPVCFDVQLSLASYDLPMEALVAVEAYRQTSWERFSCGSVRDLVLPENQALTEFDTADGLLFRVRVTSGGDPEGLLLAEANRIRPRESVDAEQDRISLLPVKPDPSLGERIYTIDFTDSPLLLINAELGDWRSAARDPVFVSLVYPAAIREVLTRILHIEKHFELEDLADWRSQWLHFAACLPGVGDPPTQDEFERVEDWIGEAVSSFSRQHRFLRMFSNYWTEEDLA